MPTISSEYGDIAIGVVGTAFDLARRVSVLMTYAARRAFAEYWWLRGFSASGRGFHGETYDRVKHPALTALLVSEFERAWHELHPPGPFPPRRTR
jgi:hypothetical protein